jgi:hypothetical protein
MSAILHLVLPRACKGCGRPCDTAGNHCASCCEKLPALPLVFVQSTLAGAIRDAEKLESSGPARMALLQMRQAYDAITPRIRSPQIGVVRFDGEFWAHPEHSSECVGPFHNAEAACTELLNRIAGVPHVGE